jgi:hypothetical protein
MKNIRLALLAHDIAFEHSLIRHDLIHKTLQKKNLPLVTATPTKQLTVTNLTAFPPSIPVLCFNPKKKEKKVKPPIKKQKETAAKDNKKKKNRAKQKKARKINR